MYSSERVNKIVSILAFLLALPTTIAFGPLTLMFSLGKVESLQDAYVFLFGLFGLWGICGLWLRVVIRPSKDKSFSASDMVTLLLSAGSISSMGWTITLVYSEYADYFMEFPPMAIASLCLTIMVSALSVHNFLANRSLRRSVS